MIIINHQYRSIYLKEKIPVFFYSFAELRITEYDYLNYY